MGLISFRHKQNKSNATKIKSMDEAKKIAQEMIEKESIKAKLNKGDEIEFDLSLLPKQEVFEETKEESIDQTINIQKENLKEYFETLIEEPKEEKKKSSRKSNIPKKAKKAK